MKLKELYDQIGEDYEMVLKRLMNNEGLLKKYLVKFIDDQNFNDLERAIEAGTFEEVLAKAHTLKGVSSNLGLKPLYETSAAIVEAVRKGDKQAAAEFFEKLKPDYENVIKLISNLE